jgi:hypothetical protein
MTHWLLIFGVMASQTNFAFAGAPNEVVDEAIRDAAQINGEVAKAGQAPCAACSVAAKKGPPKDRRAELFKSNETLELVMKADFPKFSGPDGQQGHPWPTKLSYMDHGKKVELDVELEKRGAGRAGWCKFGPLKIILKHKKKEGEEGEDHHKLKGTVFDHTDRSMKLINHCQSQMLGPADGNWNSVVMTEYALYKVMEAAGLPTFSTRLAHVKFLNLDGSNFNEGYMFFLESADDFARRNGLAHPDKKNREVAAEKAPESARVPYELGLRFTASEVDHGFQSSHNSFAFVPKDAQAGANAGIQVPYDLLYSPGVFPYSPRDNSHHPEGWLKSYAEKHPDLVPEIRHWAQTMLSRRTEVDKAIKQVPFPPGATQPRDMKRWIDEFYADAESYLREAK